MSIHLVTGTVHECTRELHGPAGLVCKLTNNEFLLLQYLAERPNQVVSRDTLLVEVWGHATPGASRAVDHTMRRLRDKVEADSSIPQHLMAVYGEGYRFLPCADDPPEISDDPAAVVVGWPAPSRVAADLLHVALERSRSLGDGYLGLEHIVHAFAVADVAGAATTWVRRVMPDVVASLFDCSSHLTPTAVADAQIGLSPRLERVQQLLHSGFEPEDLAAAVVREVADWSHLTGGPPPAGTREDTWSTHQDIDAQIAGALQVMGGPEDGRVVWMHPGDTLGRAGREGPVHPLYQHSSLTDRRLSRRHLEWLGSGHVRVRRPAVLRQFGHEQQVSEAHLLAGDLLRLTVGTTVRALPLEVR